MNTQSVLRSDLGLRHVIEDAIGIVRGNAISEARRAYVLGDLEELFSKVVRGHELAQSSSLFIGSDDRGAFEASSQLDRFLPPTNPTAIRDAFKASATRLAEMRDGHALSPAQRSELEKFLQEILVSIERQDSSGLLNEPEQISLAG